jgi:hypothetical protein
MPYGLARLWNQTALSPMAESGADAAHDNRSKPAPASDARKPQDLTVRSES